MTRFSIAVLFGFGALMFVSGAPVAFAQEAGDGPPQSGIVEPEDDGRRLGNVPNDQMRQFKMRRACEMDLPECLPAVREIIEAEERQRMYMGVGIAAVLLLIVLLAMRESEKKKKRVAKEMAKHRKLGKRLKSKWGEQAKDPYKDHDPLGDE